MGRAQLLKERSQKMSYLNMLQGKRVFPFVSFCTANSHIFILNTVRMSWVSSQLSSWEKETHTYTQASHYDIKHFSPTQSAEVLLHSTFSLDSQTLQHLTNAHLLTFSFSFIHRLNIISLTASSSKSRLIPRLLVCLCFSRLLHIHPFLTSSSFLIHFYPPHSWFVSVSGRCLFCLHLTCSLHLSF